MGKKYIPSGYQIINLDLSDKTSGTPFDPETDDEKLLCDLLHNGVKKPILLQISGLIGYPVVNGNALYLTSGPVGSSSTTIIESDGSQLTYTLVEE